MRGNLERSPLTSIAKQFARDRGARPPSAGPTYETDAGPRRTRKPVWDEAEIAVNIEYTESGTALYDHLRKEQTRAVLNLLADYRGKLDKNGRAER